MEKRMVEIDLDAILYRIWSIRATMVCREFLSSDISILEESLDDILNNIYLKASNVSDWFKFKFNKSPYISSSYMKVFLRESIKLWNIEEYQDGDDLTTLIEDVNELYDEVFYESYEDMSPDEVMWDTMSNMRMFIDDEFNEEGYVEMCLYGGRLYNITINDERVVSSLSNPDERILAKEFIRVTVDAIDYESQIIAMKVYEDKVNILVVSGGGGSCMIGDGAIKFLYVSGIASVIFYEYLEKIKKERTELAS